MYVEFCSIGIAITERLWSVLYYWFENENYDFVWLVTVIVFNVFLVVSESFGGMVISPPSLLLDPVGFRGICALVTQVLTLGLVKYA